MRPDGLRPDLYVVVRMLEALWRNGNRMRPTHLQLAAGINYSRFERYLAFLESRALVVRSGGDAAETFVDLTPAGHDALRFLAQGMQQVLGLPLNGTRAGVAERSRTLGRRRASPPPEEPVDRPAGSED